VDNASVINTFGYNARSDLTDALMGASSYGYVYDEIGNRQRATSNSIVWTYERLNVYSST
jgi:hypothetical protein